MIVFCYSLSSNHLIIHVRSVSSFVHSSIHLFFRLFVCPSVHHSMIRSSVRPSIYPSIRFDRLMFVFISPSICRSFCSFILVIPIHQYICLSILAPIHWVQGWTVSSPKDGVFPFLSILLIVVSIHLPLVFLCSLSTCFCFSFVCLFSPSQTGHPWQLLIVY